MSETINIEYSDTTITRTDLVRLSRKFIEVSEEEIEKNLRSEYPNLKQTKELRNSQYRVILQLEKLKIHTIKQTVTNCTPRHGKEHRLYNLQRIINIGERYHSAGASISELNINLYFGFSKKEFFKIYSKIRKAQTKLYNKLDNLKIHIYRLTYLIENPDVPAR